MKKETEIKWLVSLLGLMILVAGLITDFGYGELEFQLHDSYFVVGAYSFIVYGAWMIYTIKSLFLLIDLLAERYKVIALLISIINPLVALFVVVLLYLGLQRLAELRSDYVEIQLSGRLVPVIFLLTLLIGQVIVEVRMLRKLRGLITA